MILLGSCTKEESITAREPFAASRFEFPQGDKEYDRELVKIYDRFYVKCIYDGITRDDLNKSWKGSAIGESGNYGKPLDTDELRNFYTIFFRDNIFKYLDTKVTSGILPQHIYFVQDSYQRSALGTNPDGSAKYYDVTLNRHYGGMDFWSFSFLSEPHYAFSPKPWQDVMPKEVLDYIKIKEPILKTIVDKMIKKGVIQQPAFLAIENATDLDYVTPIKNNILEVNDLNYFKRRGFPETLRNLLNYATPGVITNYKDKVQITPNELFVDYLWLGIRYTREKILENYALFPLVIKYYDLVAEYMKVNYNIDLNSISEDPKLIN